MYSLSGKVYSVSEGMPPHTQVFELNVRVGRNVNEAVGCPICYDECTGRYFSS